MLDTLRQLQQVFVDVFEQPELQIAESTSAKDIAAWDSLMHVGLMVRVESAFGVRFTSRQLAQISTVGDLVKAIEAQHT
jgi:acyl carrier protein